MQIALIGAPIGIAIGAGKLAEFIERKVEGGSAFVDAQDELDKQLKDAGMDSKGRIGYTNSRGRFIKKGDRNAEQEALFKKVQAKRKELRKLRDDMRNEMDAQKATVQMSGTRTGGRDKGRKYFTKEDNEKKDEIEATVRSNFEAKIDDIIARKRGGRGARGRTILVGEDSLNYSHQILMVR